MHFNISHSGEWVVCALDSLPVGVDVEEIKEAPFEISKRFFSREERTFLFNEAEEVRNESFYYIWTLKESYIKAIGQGLSYGLESFTVLPGSNWVKHEHGNEEKTLWNEKLDARHVVALCTAPKRSRNVEKMALSAFIKIALEALA
nr:4'-phosphopantetheinyl transferase superfamily protein [Paenibacillus dendrobii]